MLVFSSPALPFAGWTNFDGLPVIDTRCPPLKVYPKNTLSKAAKELRAMPSGSVTPGLVRDYRVLRDQCRAYRAPAQ